jgi:hypothetical protein
MINPWKLIVFLVLTAVCAILVRKILSAKKKEYNTISNLQIYLHICCCVLLLLVLDIVRDLFAPSLVRGGAYNPFLSENYVEDYSPLRRQLRWYERVSNWFEQKFLGHEFIQ